MRRTFWIGLAAVAALAAGLWAAKGNFGRPSPPSPPPSPPPTAAELADPGADVVAQAMREAPSAPVDSAEIKSRWQDEVRGVDAGGLDARRLEMFVRYANAERCTCGCGYTLAGCKASDMSCEVSGARLEALRDSIRAGRIRSARGIRARPTGT